MTVGFTWVKARIWYKGSPPHIGWWNASSVEDESAWRWWNGFFWSKAVYGHSTVSHIKTQSGIQTECANIEWTYYWPENARVPRIIPD